MQVRRTRAKVPPPRYPIGVEYAYRKVLLRLVHSVRDAFLYELAQNGPALVAEAQAYRASIFAMARRDALREDATGWGATLLALFLRIADAITGRLTEGLTQVGGIARQTDAAGRQMWARQVRAAYGVDILRNEPQLATLLSAWEGENLGLIKSIPETIYFQLRSEFTKGLVDGVGLKDLTRMVRERTGVGEKRAVLIARDQIGKLNGQLAEMRQRSIGVREYFWRTSQDERVRPTHRVRNGKRYSWASKEIKPGQEIRCRCNAEPIFPEVLGEDED